MEVQINSYNLNFTKIESMQKYHKNFKGFKSTENLELPKAQKQIGNWNAAINRFKIEYEGKLPI
jgi:hypothetical protein